MSRNHRNRSWRAHWTLSEVRGIPVANHRNGVVAMIVAGEVLVDTTQARGTHVLSDEVYLDQAQRLFDAQVPEDEPDDGPAPRM